MRSYRSVCVVICLLRVKLAAKIVKGERRDAEKPVFLTVRASRRFRANGARPVTEEAHERRNGLDADAPLRRGAIYDARSPVRRKQNGG